MEGLSNHVQERSQRGQSLVEFAFSLVLLLVLLVGIVDLSRALYTYLALRDAAAEGAIVGSMYPDDLDAIRQRVIDSSSVVNDLNLSGGDIQVSFSDANPCQGSLITVTVVYDDFQITMPLLGALLGSQTFTIQATVSATVLLPAC